MKNTLMLEPFAGMGVPLRFVVSRMVNDGVGSSRAKVILARYLNARYFQCSSLDARHYSIGLILKFRLALVDKSPNPFATIGATSE